ncbi:hypothetical protein FRC01_000787 [Tulasnella sp. 417]|nr:hypothetical protein FRC01_000787 [Tulasnella sp. 417]
MKHFNDQKIDTSGAIEQVSALFNGHPSLVQGFNILLSPGWTSPLAPAPGPKPITWVLDAGPYFEMVRTELQEQPTVYDRFMVLFEDLETEAISMGIFVEQATALFAGHRALIAGLEIFLPPGYSVGAIGPEQDATVSSVLLEATVSTPSSSSTWARETPQYRGDSYMDSRSLALAPTALPFSSSRVLIDDLELAITWISSMPVKVALKRPRLSLTDYDDVIARRFEREATTWRRLRHPHILKFLGTLERDGHLYFVSPFINNGTLVDYIIKSPDANRIRVLCETADALQYLHQEGVIHGDIKASNILIEDDGHSLLCDFGLTKTVDARTSTAMRGAGTFRWQSPELWEDAPKSFESDVYAFGITIAEGRATSKNTVQIPKWDML